MGIMGMTRAVWVGQERVWVGHGLPGLIARTASVRQFVQLRKEREVWLKVSLHADMSDSSSPSLQLFPVAAATGRRDAAWRYHLNVVGGHVCPSTGAGRLKYAAAGGRPRTRGHRTATQLADKPIAKASVEHDVDDEVDGRVEGEHRVRYLADRLDQMKHDHASRNIHPTHTHHEPPRPNEPYPIRSFLLFLKFSA